MHNDVPTTCFGRFLTGHHQVRIQCQRNYILTISIDISISTSTEKGGGGRDLVTPPFSVLTLILMFPNWPSSGLNKMSEELYTYYKCRHQY